MASAFAQNQTVQGQEHRFPWLLAKCGEMASAFAQNQTVPPEDSVRKFRLRIRPKKKLKSFFGGVYRLLAPGLQCLELERSSGLGSTSRSRMTSIWLSGLYRSYSSTKSHLPISSVNLLKTPSELLAALAIAADYFLGKKVEVNSWE